MPAFRPVAVATFAVVSVAALAACAHRATAQPDHDRSARMSGVILHPAQAVPAMRICALSDKSVATPAPDVCIRTRAGADDYTLTGLQPGTYQVVAALDHAGTRVGGHVRPVQCIRAPCPDMLAEITLAAGEHRENIDINGFYPERADFPAMP